MGFEKLPLLAVDDLRSRVRDLLRHRDGLRNLGAFGKVTDLRERDFGIYGRSEKPLVERLVDLGGIGLRLRIQNVVRIVVFAQEIPRPFGRHF